MPGLAQQLLDLLDVVVVWMLLVDDLPFSGLAVSCLGSQTIQLLSVRSLVGLGMPDFVAMKLQF